MKRQYRLEDKTPQEMSCLLVGCPAIYEVHEITPKEMQCGFGACPAIHADKRNYYIIGKQVNPKSIGLEKKVGEGEVLIQVPKKLIDKMRR